jgi:DNA modification methylase
MSIETQQLTEGEQTKLPADSLEPHPRNQEIYTNGDISDIVERMREHGFKEEHRLLVTPQKRILSGHRRWRSAKAVGVEQIPVEVVEVEDDTEALFRLLLANEYRDKTAAEKINEAQAWREYYESDKSAGLRTNKKYDQKAAQKVDIGERSIEKGRKVKEIATGERKAPDRVVEVAKEQWEAMKKDGEEGQTINGAYQEVRQEEKKVEIERQQETVDLTISKGPGKEFCPEVERGELWQLGDHYLFCGDSSSSTFKQISKRHFKSDFEFAFADPPYNAGVSEWDEDFEWQHDYLTNSADVVAVTPGIESIKDFMRRTEMPYEWSVSSWIDNGMTRGALGFGNWVYIALFTDSESLHQYSQDMARVSIKTEENTETDHKGRKPSELMQWLFDRFVDEGPIVDPFLGSGTTLIAADEMTDASVLGAEINPTFCSEIIGRWSERTENLPQVVENE